MLATLHDVSAGSRRSFAREIADLVRLGLRMRAASTASAGARRLLADGLCLAAVWLMTLDVSTLLSQRARGMHDPLLSAPSIALLAAVLALALIGHDRLAGAGALVWTALRLPALWDHHAGLVNLAPEVLPIVCFCVLVLAPRRRAPDLRRLAWLLVPATLVAAAGPPPGEASPLLVAGVLLAALLVVVGGRRAAADRPTPGDRGRRLGQQPRGSPSWRSTTTARSWHACSSPPPRSSSPLRSSARAGCVAPRPSSRAPALPTPNLSLGIG